MTVQIFGAGKHSTLINQNEKVQERRMARQNQGKDQVKNGSVNMNALNGKMDTILMRRQRAQGKAMKIVKNAWIADKRIDLKIQERTDRIGELQKNINENMGKIRDCETRKEDLRETYGINADSQEQKDLEIMEKAGLYHVLSSEGTEHKIADMLWYAPYIREINLDALTEEEQERLEEIADQSLSEYQYRALSVDCKISNCDAENEKMNKEIVMESDEIREIKNERMKEHTMLDAQKEAEDVLEDAGKEIIGMLIGESQDHIDKELAEKIEKAKEEAKEKEEQEEKLEERREEKEEQQEQLEIRQEENREAEEIKTEQRKNARKQSDLLEEVQSNSILPSSNTAEAQLAIKEMLQRMKLLEEDLKGASVDAKPESFTGKNDFVW